jgi:hypothetical protein
MSASRSFDSVPAFEDSDQRSLDLLIGNIAEILNSEVALYCQPGGNGQPPQVLCSFGLGPLHEQPVRPGEGGFVGRALGYSARPSSRSIATMSAAASSRPATLSAVPPRAAVATRIEWASE